MKKRVGILTSGGDCPGLNATIRGVAKALYARMGDNVEIVGILNGYHGLINGEYKEMCEDDFRGILTLGGTILGTKRTPFKLMRVVEDDKIDKVAAMKKTYKDAKLDCLLCLGGNGTHKTANLLSQEGLNIIGLPKTIDNDIYGTDVTFGFHTAVDIATEVIDRIHTTAGSHSRVMCIEIMGNKAGWLTLYSGIAGGADIILLPEQPYDIDRVCEAVERRGKARLQLLHHRRGRGCHERGRGQAEAQGVGRQARRGRLHHRHQPHCRRRPEKDRHGDPRLHPGPHAARRQPQRLRPRAGHPVRQLRRQAGGDRAVRRYGGSS